MFQKILDIQYPRLLSQACRDENSPFYGCYDRNWWHYRIRDFSSIMLQQGGYTAFQYAKNPEYKEYQQGLLQLAAASAMFWNERSRKKGAFEEYYPWEQGYPPLAFSTLAMTKLYLEGLIEKELISDGIKLAARQLQKRFEFQAGNQQVAGLAALAAIRKIEPELVSEEKYKEQKRKTLALQVEEGWYTEYDGPDLGYLSVTLDCLWDLYDITEDADYLNSAEKAFDFLYAFIGRRFEGAGMHNARNTDYIVPYGICRFLETKNSEASFLLHTLYLNLDDKEHFFYAVDDRYWSHYIGHSVARAQLILSAGKIEINDVKTPALDASFTFEESGYIFRKLNDVSSILISTKKGGVFSIFSNSETLFNDFGWITASGKKQFVNHWWSDDSWKIEQEENTVMIKGNLFPHSEKTSTPFLHFGLRTVSFFFGSSLTRVLRNVLIFKSKPSGYTFERKFTFDGDSVYIDDVILGKNAEVGTSRAPRTSKRHVASADSWHKEDFNIYTKDNWKEELSVSRNGLKVKTVLSVNELLSTNQASE